MQELGWHTLISLDLLRIRHHEVGLAEQWDLWVEFEWPYESLPLTSMEVPTLPDVQSLSIN